MKELNNLIGVASISFLYNGTMRHYNVDSIEELKSTYILFKVGNEYKRFNADKMSQITKSHKHV